MRKASPGFCFENVRAAVAFYEEKLGFRCCFKLDDAQHPEMPYAIVQRGDVAIHLSLNPEVGSTAKPFVQIEVDDVDAIYAEYLDAGVHVERAIENSSYGKRDFVVTDLEGNRLMIGQGLATYRAS